jgi:hypothetical protein
LAKSISDLELEINNSPFFTLSGANTEAARSTAKSKLWLNLLKLSEYIWYKKKNLDEDKYVSVIHETIIKCLEKFDHEKGVFTYFFKNQVKFAFDNWDRKELNTNKREKKYAQNENMYENTQSQSDEIIENTENLRIMTEYLEVIEQTFKGKQDRVKPYLRTVWTHICFDILLNIDIFDTNYTWIDYDFLKKYMNEAKKPTQRKVAAMHDRVEQDISRSIRQFRKLIAPKLRKIINTKL